MSSLLSSVESFFSGKASVAGQSSYDVFLWVGLLLVALAFWAFFLKEIESL